MSIEDRLAAAGMNYGLAAEVVAALKTGASTTAVRLSSFGLSGTTAIELARQVNARSADIGALAGIGFGGVLAGELAKTIQGAVTVARTALINFGSNTAAAPANNVGLGTNISLNDTTGASTGWTYARTELWGGASATGGKTTGNNSGAFPDDCLVSYNFLSDEALAGVLISGLSAARLYRVEVICSKDGAGTVININANNGAVSGSIDSTNNTSAPLVLDNVQPTLQNGLYRVLVTMAGVQNSVVNAMRFTEKA